jgi:hypothetical protein
MTPAPAPPVDYAAERWRRRNMRLVLVLLVFALAASHSRQRTFITKAAKTRPVVACGIFKSSLVTVASPRRSDTLRATAGPSRMWSG